MFAVAFALWVAWTLRHATHARTEHPAPGTEHSAPGIEHAAPSTDSASVKDVLIFLLVVSPMAAYVYGALELGWYFNELSAGFFVAGMAAGVLGGMGLTGTARAYLDGMQSLIPAAVMVGVARSITVVLGEGHVIDTILHGLATPLGQASPQFAALLMIPFHAIIHVAVPSVSGHAVLTMPVLVPLSDLVGISRQVTVMAYQTGAGLTELVTPTNGALMAVLVSAGVSFGRWVRFAGAGVLLLLPVGVAAMLLLR
jgi:uncharacterized ion transporter superfamily protein YfcC